MNRKSLLINIIKQSAYDGLNLSDELSVLLRLFSKETRKTTEPKTEYVKVDMGFQNPLYNTQYHNIGSYGVPHIKNPNRNHEGVDLAAERGAPVYAASSGRVSYAGYGKSSGNMVQIEHDNGYKTNYMHLDSIDVSVGQKVNTNTVIGTVGDTGNAKGTAPHLHFEVRKGSIPVNPASVGIEISSPDIAFMRGYGKTKKV